MRYRGDHGRTLWLLDPTSPRVHEPTEACLILVGDNDGHDQASTKAPRLQDCKCCKRTHPNDLN